MEQTIFKIGDKVKVVSNIYGTRAKIGKMYQIQSGSGLPIGSQAMTHDYYTGMEVGIIKGRVNIALYHGDLTKGYTSRKEQAEYLKEEVISMRRDIKTKEDEIEVLLKYKDEAEELAAKIADIIKNKNDTDAIAEILRKHKTDLL